MKRPSPLWPDPDHDRLLRAALLDRGVAQTEFALWRRDRDLDALDPASTRLLPLVARNLEGGEPPDDPFRRRVAAVARAAWLKAQTVVARARPLFAALGDAGLTPLLIKGWAVAPAYAGDPRLRPMDDLDFAVLRSARALAWRLLVEQGFRPIGGIAETHGALDRRISWNFSAGGAADVDLHWHLLDFAPREEMDRAIERDAVESDLAGIPCRALAPEDAFLSAVLHAARWEPVRPVRWAADAVLLVRARGAAFGWDRLVERARAAHAEAPLASALDYLGRRLGLAVPPRQRRRLSRPPLWRRIEHRAALTAAPARSRTERLALAVGADLRRTARPGDRLGNHAALAALARLRDLRHPLWLPTGVLFAACDRPAWLRRWLAPPRRPETVHSSDAMSARGLELGIGGEEGALLGAGWSWAEPGGRWTDGPEAVLHFRAPEGLGGPDELELVLVPFLAPSSPDRRLEVLLDDRLLGVARWTGTGLHRRGLRFRLGRRFATRSLHELRLVVRSPCSPHAAGVNYDSRFLGVFVESVRIWSRSGDTGGNGPTGSGGEG